VSAAGTTTDHPRKGYPIPPAIVPERTLSPGQWGMIAFFVSEVALFSTLIVVYVFYLGKNVVGPTPAEALSLTLILVPTLCLFSSSGTVHLAEKTLERGGQGRFILWWGLTTLLGIAFLTGTAFEWHDLIYHHDLTISRNLFGTTFYTLVGLHALHVTGGVILLLIVFSLALRQQVTAENPGPVGLVSWYWHFVDVVWVVVFTVVYLLGR
jgi:cytochrome c oxidase subunit 3